MKSLMMNKSFKRNLFKNSEEESKNYKAKLDQQVQRDSLSQLSSLIITNNGSKTLIGFEEEKYQFV